MKKSVAIMAFGPSLFKKKYKVENIPAWSMNWCYDIFAASQNEYWLPKISRVFEMHRPEKVLARKSQLDGRTHLEWLQELADKGTQIIMQNPHPDIFRSERYPIEMVEADLGVDLETRYWGVPFWNGTPPYCLALAIHEGYEEIHLIGCDATDPKHRRQQRTMAYLHGRARERGIRIKGITMNSYSEPGRYGYDFGPEWDAKQNAELWQDYGFELIYEKLDWRKKD